MKAFAETSTGPSELTAIAWTVLIDTDPEHRPLPVGCDLFQESAIMQRISPFVLIAFGLVAGWCPCGKAEDDAGRDEIFSREVQAIG